MELKPRSALIYGLLLGIWVLLVGWQAEDHFRFREEARGALVKQAGDISTTLGIVLRLRLQGSPRGFPRRTRQPADQRVERHRPVERHRRDCRFRRLGN
jgi:hypothetical protein